MQFTESTQFDDIVVRLKCAEYIRNRVWDINELTDNPAPSLYKLAIDEIEKLRAEIIDKERGK